jgi:pullulanase
MKYTWKKRVSSLIMVLVLFLGLFPISGPITSASATEDATPVESESNSGYSVTPPSGLVSPVIHSDQSVTFNVYSTADAYTDSNKLYVYGDFNGWSANNDYQMTYKGDGIYSVTTPPLSVGEHVYKFVVNGVYFIDPLNATKSGDNSAFTITPDNSSGIVSPVVDDSGTGNVIFNFEPTGPYANATTVHVAGSFTSWGDGMVSMTKENGVFTLPRNFAPGNYEYKYVIDGSNWITDPLNTKMSAGNNSLLTMPGMVLGGNHPAGVGDHQLSAYLTTSAGVASDATNTVTWSIKDPVAGASISSGGVLTTTKDTPNGNITVIVTYHDNGAKNREKTLYYTKRALLLQYLDPNADPGVDLWVWGNSAGDGEYNFSSINGIRTSRVTLSDSDRVDVGFIVRNYGAWGDNDREFEGRNIPTNSGETYTKARVSKGTPEVTVLPSGKSYFNNGIIFNYRDDDLFYQNKMGEITQVDVVINDVHYPMVYSEVNELFTFAHQDIEVGDYEYYFDVTMNDVTTQVNDQYNNIVRNGHSVLTYSKPVVQLATALSPSEINYDQNSVLTVTVDSEADIKGIYADLSELGVNEPLVIDPVLKSISVYVSEKVTAGIKSIPITVIDEYGNKHVTHASLTVVPKTTMDSDWDEARIYFMLTDRFFDGDESNNGVGYDKNYAESYHGGDFAGVTSKMDYLKDLGINTIWITPIVDNIDKMVDVPTRQYGYHGYWAQDFTTIDEHLGDKEKFKTMLDAAHDRGIKVMVDVVVNHAGYGTNASDHFTDMLRTHPGTDLITSEQAFLPDFITENAEVRDKLVKWQTDWAALTTDKGNKIDYYRVDTVKHVESATWQALKNSLTKVNPNFKMIGEYFDASVDVNGDYLGNGQMDSLLDFDFKQLAANFVNNGSIDSVEATLEERNSKLTNYLTMGQFLSSHDEDGFLSSRISMDTSKMKVAAALEITIKGQPVIYYGEEINLSGPNAFGNLNNNRYDMQWTGLTTDQTEMRNHYKKLLNIRAQYSKVFSKGTHEKIGGSDTEKYLAFSRTYNGESVVVALNTTTTAKSVTFSVPFASGLEIIDQYNAQTYTVGSDGNVTIMLPASTNGGTAILTTVNDVPLTLTDISVKTPATKLSYKVGDTLNVSGLIIQATYSDGSKVDVPVTVDMVSGFDNKTASANQTLTITYNGKKTSYTIAITEDNTNNPTAPITVTPPATTPNPISSPMIKMIGDTLTVELPLNATEVTIPRDLFNKLLSNKAASLKITSENSLSLVFDSKGIEAILKAASTGNIVIQMNKVNSASLSLELQKLIGDRPIYDFTVHVGSIKVSNFNGGRVKISLPYNMKSAEDSNKVVAYYIDNNGIHHSVRGKYNAVTGTVDIITTHFSMYAIANNSVSFKDVPANAYYAPAVNFLSARGITTGIGNGNFGSKLDVTRADFIVMMLKAFNVEVNEHPSSNYTDAGSTYYTNYLGKAKELGISNGVGNNSFNPTQEISRQELFTFLYRMLVLSDEMPTVSSGKTLGDFTDADHIDSSFAESLEALVKTGIVAGSNGQLNPTDNAKRSEIAQVLYVIFSQ